VSPEGASFDPESTAESEVVSPPSDPPHATSANAETIKVEEKARAKKARETIMTSPFSKTLAVRTAPTARSRMHESP
jgi:hypothetical protein